MEPPRGEIDLFLLAMQEFGLFEALERHLPAEFAAIYEIARVLYDPQHPLAHRFAPLMGLLSTGQERAPEPAPTAPPLQFVAEEYDAELIRHYRDVVRIYPHQFLLPEEVFYHRLAERSLWMPVPRPPRVYGYQTHSELYAPDIRKQKVYVLLDTSASMQAHHRIQLAKAVVYVFLRRNQAELGEIFLRTFDLQIGELHHAYDRLTFERLLQTVLRLQALGQGTALEQAIVTAAEDIRRYPSLVESEILLITDGIAYVHVPRVRALLHPDIRLHVVHLGHGQVQLEAKAIEDFAYRDESETSLLYRRLADEKRHVEKQLAHASGEQQRRFLQSQLRALEQQLEAVRGQLRQQAYHHYSEALRELATVYVAVEDMPLSQLVELSPERQAALQQAAEQLLQRLQTEPTGEDLRTAAVVAEYLHVLAQCCPEAEALEKLGQQLRNHLRRLLQQGEYGTAGQSVGLSRMERQQIQLLAAMPGVSLAQLLRWLSPRWWLRRMRLWVKRLVWRLRYRVSSM